MDSNWCYNYDKLNVSEIQSSMHNVEKLFYHFSRELLDYDLWFLKKVLPSWWVEYNAKKKKNSRSRSILRQILYTYFYQIESVEATGTNFSFHSVQLLEERTYFQAWLDRNLEASKRWESSLDRPWRRRNSTRTWRARLVPWRLPRHGLVFWPTRWELRWRRRTGTRRPAVDPSTGIRKGTGRRTRETKDWHRRPPTTAWATTRRYPCDPWWPVGPSGGPATSPPPRWHDASWSSASNWRDSLSSVRTEWKSRASRWEHWWGCCARGRPPVWSPTRTRRSLPRCSRRLASELDNVPASPI